MAIPVTHIQIEAHPAKIHRVVFPDTDEITGNRFKSLPYGTHAEALEAWATSGITGADIETTDARIDSLHSLLSDLESAFVVAGAEGVTHALAERDYKQSLSVLHGASIGFELVSHGSED